MKGALLRQRTWRTGNRAGFGHRHGAARRARIATRRVDDAQDRIAAIPADGAPIKEHLDALEAGARRFASSPA